MARSLVSVILEADLANLSGSVLAGTHRTSIEVNRYSLKARSTAMPASAEGTGETRLELPSSTGKNLSLWTTFDGYVGDAPLAARLGLDGTALDVVADVPKVGPEAIRAIYPAWPIYDEVSGHVEAAEASIDSRRRLGSRRPGARRRPRGALDRRVVSHRVGAIEARDVALRSILPSAPPANLSASGTLGLAAQGGNVTGSIALAARPFRIEGIDVGEASIDAKLDQGEVKGRATVRDPRLPAQIDFDVHPGLGNAPLVLGFEGRARAPDLAAVPWLTAVGQGAANVHAKGELAAGRLDAHFDGSVSRFARDGVTLGRGQFTGSLREAKGQLVVDANLAGDEFQVGPLYAPRMQATTRGPPLAPRRECDGVGRRDQRAPGAGGGAPYRTGDTPRRCRAAGPARRRCAFG